MAGDIEEFFGYAAADTSQDTLTAAARSQCPFLCATCTKTLSHGDGRV